MESTILVSIIIPLYNKEQYIDRFLNSVCRQTYNNIECIIINDCSTDNSLKLVDRFVNNYTGNIRFVLIDHKKNGGPSVSRNAGINNASGDYLFFLDADDEITENSITSLVKLAEKYPGVEMVQGNSLKHTEKAQIPRNKKGELPEFTTGNFQIKKHYFGLISVTPWNKLIKKDFITDNNLYFKKGIKQEDTHWKYFFFKYINSFAFTDEITYNYYIVPDSMISNPNIFYSISSRLRIAEDMLLNLDIDILDEQLLRIRELLGKQKKRILEDEKFSSLLPKCNELMARLPKSSFFLLLPLRMRGKCFLRMIKNTIFKSDK